MIASYAGENGENREAIDRIGQDEDRVRMRSWLRATVVFLFPLHTIERKTALWRTRNKFVDLDRIGAAGAASAVAPKATGEAIRAFKTCTRGPPR